MGCIKHSRATLSAFLIVVCWNPRDECRALPKAVMHHGLFMECQEVSVLWLAAGPLEHKNGARTLSGREGTSP